MLKPSTQVRLNHSTSTTEGVFLKQDQHFASVSWAWNRRTCMSIHQPWKVLIRCSCIAWTLSFLLTLVCLYFVLTTFNQGTHHLGFYLKESTHPLVGYLIKINKLPNLLICVIRERGNQDQCNRNVMSIKHYLIYYLSLWESK